MSNKYAKHFRGVLVSLFAKKMHNYPYKLQLAQKIMCKYDSREQFALKMLYCIEEDETYLNTAFL
jgi:hypothetical protein